MKAAALVLQLMALALMASAAFGQTVDTKSVFTEVIERRKAKVQSLSIRILPEKTTIASEEKKLTNGKTQVLSIPVSLENWSSDEITSTISHEWYGGIHPPTDLYAAVKVMDPAELARNGFSFCRAVDQRNRGGGTLIEVFPAFQICGKDLLR